MRRHSADGRFLSGTRHAAVSVACLGLARTHHSLGGMKRSLKERCACGGRGRAGVGALSFTVYCSLLCV